MTHEERSTLARRFVQSYGSLDTTALARRFYAVVGTEDLPDTPEGALALSALNKLRKGDAAGPSPNEWAALEYMIQLMRPSQLIQKGMVNDDPDPDFRRAFSDWEEFRAAVPTFAFSVGKISRVTSAGDAPEGTGFVVAEQVIMTNMHVLVALSHGTRTLERGQANVQFLAEYGDTNETAALDITGVRAVHPVLDACLLEVDDPKGRGALAFSHLAPGETTQVAAIGFPYPDDRDPLFVDHIFRGKFGVKRAAPGFILGTQPEKDLLYHDCSTLGGNSGSPVISMSDGKVLGMHSSGGFLWRNEAIESKPLASWIGQQRLD